jgi:hypothetical protein
LIAKSLLLNKYYNQPIFGPGSLFELGVFLGIDSKHYEELQRLDKVITSSGLIVSLVLKDEIITFTIDQSVENTAVVRLLFAVEIQCPWFNNSESNQNHFDLMINSPIEVAAATLKAAASRRSIKISASTFPLTNLNAETCGRFIIALFNASRNLDFCTIQDLKIIPKMSVLAQFALSRFFSGLLVHKNKLLDCLLDFSNDNDHLFLCGNNKLLGNSNQPNIPPKLILINYREPWNPKYQLFAVPKEEINQNVCHKDNFKDGKIIFTNAREKYIIFNTTYDKLFATIQSRFYENNSSLSVKKINTDLTPGKIRSLTVGIIHSLKKSNNAVLSEFFDIATGDCLVSLTADFTLALEQAKLTGIIEIPDQIDDHSIDCLYWQH